VPIVSTALGTRGLALDAPAALLAADGADAFAAAVLASLADPAGRRERAARALAIVRERHDRVKVVAALACRFAAIAAA
jgi:hypothetical protein